MDDVGGSRKNVVERNNRQIELTSSKEEPEVKELHV